MNALRSVFAAFANLAASVNALAGVIDAASGRLQKQLALDYEPDALAHHGEVIDAEPMPSTKRNGRKATV